MTMSKIARKKIFVVESRIWNLEEPATGRAIRPLSASNMKTSIRSILFGYMWYDIHAESLLNIKGSSKNLAAMGMTEKSNFIWEFIRYLHKTQRQDNFYSILIGHWIVLYPTLNMQLISLTSKVGRVFLPKFFHDKKVKDFLKHLEYAGEYRTDNVWCEYPEIWRKYYDYRSNNTAAKTLQVTDSGWPFPETYYKSIGSTVRVSGFFPKLI